MDNQTFNDLLGFQKSQIIDNLVLLISEGNTFTWTTEGLPTSYAALNETSDNPTTLPSELSNCVSIALRAHNKAPDGYQLLSLLEVSEEAA